MKYIKKQFFYIKKFNPYKTNKYEIVNFYKKSNNK